LRAPTALATGSTLDLHPRIQPLAPVAGPTGEQLWEREREFARIEQAIEAVRASASKILLIEGPTGIGKTQLLLSVNQVRASDAGLRILLGRATELERDYPFGIARQWLEPVLAAASSEQRETLLGGAAALAYPVLSPDSVGGRVRIEVRPARSLLDARELEFRGPTGAAPRRCAVG
jgi:energy-coupling factor transporter ATP-binding protein EcfA2